jgi:hypothetical protein
MWVNADKLFSHTFIALPAVQLKAVDFHKLRNVLEEFGQRSAVAQVLPDSCTVADSNTAAGHASARPPPFTCSKCSKGIHTVAQAIPVAAVASCHALDSNHACLSTSLAAGRCATTAGAVQPAGLTCTHNRHLATAQLRPAAVPADSRGCNAWPHTAGWRFEGRHKEAVHTQGKSSKCRHNMLGVSWFVCPAADGQGSSAIIRDAGSDFAAAAAARLLLVGASSAPADRCLGLL